jgi:hypothetical protein
LSSAVFVGELIVNCLWKRKEKSRLHTLGKWDCVISLIAYSTVIEYCCFSSHITRVLPYSLCMYVCKFVCMRLYVRLYVCVCIYVCVYVLCVYVCMYVYVYVCL